MLRALALLAFAALLTLLGAAVGWGADRTQLTAALLLGEPFLLVLGLWAINVARWTRSPGLSLALTLGTVGAFAAVRLPMPVDLPSVEPPEWANAVGRCAAALRPPEDDVRVLQWALTGDEPLEAVRDVLASTRPHVVVMHGVDDPAFADAVIDQVGGEGRFHEPSGSWPGLLVVAAGGFHPCGDHSEWVESLDTEAGYTLSFVGVPPRTVFPLLVARLPSPLDGTGWGTRMAEATRRIYGAVGGVGGASLVVVGDAPAPRTFRHLDGAMAALGLGSVAVPPTWPTHIGPLPALTLHPFTRVWLGPIWQAASARAVPTPTGSRAPVLATLTGFVTEDQAAPVEIPERGIDEPMMENVPGGE